jgi:serine/threonine protein kinase
MTPERWQQIDKLFHSALALEPGERAAFLAQACAGDEPLRLEVESLISSHGDAERLLKTPMPQVAAELLFDGQGALARGQQIASYEVVELLGAGGMGEVFLAQDKRLGRKVALKLLPTYFTRDGDRLRRFEQEARAASALNHPNILTIYEIGQSDGHHFIATEFIEGVTLRRHMVSASLKLDEALDIAAQIAAALGAAHAAGIVHRDIKPENVMVRGDGYVKVLDFGLAKLTEREEMLPPTEMPARMMVDTAPGVVLGTARYMSPEQARGQAVDARADIWSLGVVLYEMVTGKAPFEGETPNHVIVSILENEPQPLAQHLERVPDELDQIVNKALRKNREERYQTIKDLAVDLRRLKQRLELARLEPAIATDSAAQDRAPARSPSKRTS